MYDWSRKEMIARADVYDLEVTTWSPGDGATRYRFYSKLGGTVADYFMGDALYTALGLAEARAFVRGWIAARTID